ncbi:MAG: SPOR domain-containing protein [Prevotella sp.]|jgi:hypothetical protein|nr:SPOR domain-containing protein [Prevotella sp.]
MEKTIFKYLEFSLPIHNCVIIPDFGGFILNMEPAIFLSTGEIDPPKHNIVFNAELSHDDGIIASCIVKDENISYNAACKKIKEFVAAIKKELKNGKTVPCGNLGSLTSDNGMNITFVRSKTFAWPAFFGLYPAGIKQLAEIDKMSVRARRDTSLKYTIGSIAAAVAAVVLFMTPIHIKDSNNRVIQNADFISTVTSSLSYLHKEPEKTGMPADSIKPADVASDDSPVNTKSVRTYYIIVGGENTIGKADKLLSKIKSYGFEDADIVEGGDRYRIYISSFDDKTLAESFLDTFRKENPEFETAWLYSKRK